MASISNNVLYYINPKSPPVPLNHVYHATASRSLSTSLPTTPSTTTTGVDSAYCPQCLTSWDGASAFSAAKGRCVKSNPNDTSTSKAKAGGGEGEGGGREVLVGCVHCPECEAILTLGVLEKKCCITLLLLQPDLPEDHSHICVYKCGYCQWNSIECGIYQSFPVGEPSSHDITVKIAMDELQLKLTEALEQKEESDLFQKLQSSWISKSNQVDRIKRRADLLRKSSGIGSGSGSGSNVGAGSSMETNNTARFIANDLDTRDGEEEKKVGSDPWSIERLEEAVQRRKERMAIQVVTSISVQGFEMNSQVLKVTDDVVIRHDENKASIVNLAAEGEIRQQFVSSGTKVHAYSDSKSKSTLNSLPTSRLPLPVALRVRSVRRCLKELDAGRPGILIKPKVNPLEGDTSLRYGHGQWWKKDSSAIHGVPRVQIKAEKYNAQSNQYALLLQVRNPTLGPIRLRLCCNVNETIEFPDSSEVILDPMTLQKATVNIMSPTQQTDQGMNMEYISLEPVEDSFLDIGKEATTEFDIDGWVQTEDLDWSLESSFRLLSVVSDVVCIQYITGSVQTREGLDENQNEECVYLGTPLSLEIEIGEESWESSLIQARVMEGEGKDLISFPILPVWRDRSYL
jgi:hypothetical protein